MGERVGWAFEYREADASAVLEPAENNEKSFMYLAECSSQWGTLVLTVAATNEIMRKLIVCTFLAGVDIKKYMES